MKGQAWLRLRVLFLLKSLLLVLSVGGLGLQILHKVMPPSVKGFWVWRQLYLATDVTYWMLVSSPPNTCEANVIWLLFHIESINKVMLEIKIIGGDAKIRMEIWHYLLFAIHSAKTLCWLWSRPCKPNCDECFFKLISKFFLSVCQYLT